MKRTGMIVRDDRRKKTPDKRRDNQGSILEKGAVCRPGPFVTASGIWYESPEMESL